MIEESNLKSLLIKDINRFEKVKNNYHRLLFRYFITSSTFRSIFFYRFLNNQYSRKGKVSKMIWLFSLLFTEIEIPYTAKIGEGLSIPHGKCIFIHNKSIIGKNFTIVQGATIGGNIFKSKNGRESPIIGDNVLIGAGAKVLGPVSVGDNCIIGANAVVITNIPKDSVAVGIPAKVVKKVDEPYIQTLAKHGI